MSDTLSYEEHQKRSKEWSKRGVARHNYLVKITKEASKTRALKSKKK